MGFVCHLSVDLIVSYEYCFSLFLEFQGTLRPRTETRSNDVILSAEDDDIKPVADKN